MKPVVRITIKADRTDQHPVTLISTRIQHQARGIHWRREGCHGRNAPTQVPPFPALWGIRRGIGQKHHQSSTPTKQASAQEKLLESVFDLYGSLAFSLALRILGESQPAEEVVLESFVSLSRCVRKLDHDPPGTELRSLLMRTVHQHSIDRLRNTAGRAQTTMSKLPLMDKGGEDVFQKLTPEIVRNALAQLPSEHLSAIDQAFYQGYSTTEIARQLGIATGTVNSWLRLGLNGLRSSFLAIGEGCVAGSGFCECICPETIALTCAHADLAACVRDTADLMISLGDWRSRRENRPNRAKDNARA